MLLICSGRGPGRGRIVADWAWSGGGRMTRSAWRCTFRRLPFRSIYPRVPTALHFSFLSYFFLLFEFLAAGAGNISIDQLIRGRCHFLKSHRYSFSFEVSHFLTTFYLRISDIMRMVLLFVIVSVLCIHGGGVFVNTRWRLGSSKATV